MTAPNPFRCYVMGSESLLVQCSELLLRDGHQILGVVTPTEEIARWAGERGLPVLAPGKDLAERIGDTPFDWFFSIANLSIIPGSVLAKPSRGAINFHDGPLPRYAGLHATTWAILRGERTHAVTWHLIEDGIDEGDILEQRTFELAERETALTLNTRCYELGIETFGAMIAALARGEEKRTEQDLSQRTYFGRYDRPSAACTIDWAQPAHRIDALVRALDYGRYPNPIGVPKAMLGDAVLLLPEVERAADSVSEAPGTVIAIDDEGLEVATTTGSLLFPRILDAEGRPLSAEAARTLGVQPGVSLTIDPGTRSRLTQLDAELAKHEAYWTRRLSELEPARIPCADPGDGAAQVVRTAVEASADPAQLLAAAGAWLSRTTGKDKFDLGYRQPEIAEKTSCAPSLYASHVPLHLEVDRSASFTSLAEQARTELDRATAHVTYPRELAARQPTARRAEWDLVLETIAGPLSSYALPPGVAAAIVTDGAQAALVLDVERLGQCPADDLSRQLETVLRAAIAQPSSAVRALPLLAEQEREKILFEWNDTASEHARDRCVHELFEAQVDRTPDHIALVAGDRSLTYRELDGRANQLAHHLIALGVRPDTPVGLSTDRSLDLMIGALGIQKAGGAYLPLDPSYPADRIAFMLEDSRAPILVGQTSRAGVTVVSLDDPEIAKRPLTRPSVPGLDSAKMAYLIYTSGSTGKPKGVMVEHRNVASFFAGMDARVPHDPPGVWLAVTSLSFDISVLELFWTLARGFTVVIASDEERALASSEESGMEMSLFYFAADEGERAGDKYRLLLEGARFADEHGFAAVWTPERHFHAFGGLYPNPAVASAALATITKRVKLRAGSCVSPLHHPIRIAEEWALVDNLSNGRVGISFAAGWQPNDFVLRPESFKNSKQRMIEDIDTVRRLWRGETMTFEGPTGPTQVRTLPRPVQPELPFWITAAGSPETFEMAGRLGGGILTHLLGQTQAEVAQKVGIYREAWAKAGHPGHGHVTLMLHTFVGDDAAEVKEIVREPMKAYLKSSMQLIQQHAWSFPAFKRHAKEGASFSDNFQSLSPEDIDALLDHSFERYYETSGLFGTPERCLEIVRGCRAIGVDEIACLIDFGIDSSTVMAHLPQLAALRAELGPAHGGHSIPAQIAHHGVTHLQCTPSMARMFLVNDEARAALSRLSHLFIGGEAFPGSLAKELRAATRARITNMYGPTETTIWSSTEPVEHPGDGTVAIGRPIANTRMYVLDDGMEPVPIGVPGELYIGGDGVARGYHLRPELTAERFIADPFVPGARMYRTGDEVRWSEDGRIEFLGRVDHQVKVRGYRIELGEIEARLASHPSVREAVVIAREDTPGDQRLVAYVIPSQGSIDAAVLSLHVRATLPTFMIPAHVVTMDRFPLTPNKKVDRKALPAPDLRPTEAPAPPEGETEEKIASIWRQILGVSHVGTRDNFFELGGHSLLAVQAHREIKAAIGRPLTVTDIFRFPTIAALAAHLDGGASERVALGASAARAAARLEPAAKRRVLRRR